MLPPTSTSMSLPSGAGGMDGSNWLLMGSPDRPRLSVPSDAFAALSTHEPPSEEWLLPPEDPQTSYNPTARFRSRAVSSLQDVSSVGFSRLGPHPPSLADVHANGAGQGSGTVGSNSGGSVYHAHLASLLSGPHPLAVDGDADATADIHQSSPNSLVPPSWHMNDELEEQRRHSLPAHLHASHESDLHHHHPLISPPLGGIQSGGGGGAHASAYHFLPRASIPLHLSAFNAANTSLSHHSPSSSSSPPTSTDLLSLFSKPAWANTVPAPMLSHRHSSLSNTSTSREGSSRGRRKNGSYSGRASLGSAMGSSSTLAAASLGSSSAHSHLTSIMPSSLMHAKRKAQLAASASAPLGSSEFGEFLDGSNTSATSLSASSGSNGKAAKIFDCPHCIRTFTRRHDAERHARIHCESGLLLRMTRNPRKVSLTSIMVPSHPQPVRRRTNALGLAARASSDARTRCSDISNGTRPSRPAPSLARATKAAGLAVQRVSQAMSHCKRSRCEMITPDPVPHQSHTQESHRRGATRISLHLTTPLLYPASSSSVVALLLSLAAFDRRLCTSRWKHM